MRLKQLMGSLDAIKGRELIGLGYGWTGYYQAMYGDHPTIYGL